MSGSEGRLWSQTASCKLSPGSSWLWDLGRALSPSTPQLTYLSLSW